jgi:hypothetical protein
MTKLNELAKMIDHSILHPTLTDADLKRECGVELSSRALCRHRGPIRFPVPVHLWIGHTFCPFLMP